MTSMVNVLKEQEQDFEWYPTTDEIIETVRDDIKTKFYDFEYNDVSILDVGAGDGRVLDSLSEFGSKYAIEKSTPLLELLSDDIFILGTEFHEQNLIDKQVKVIFCNPPYFEYQTWAEKIILEANAKYIYLVIPDRWKSSILIAESLKVRKAKTEVIGTFDFLKAERTARCVVNVVRIQLAYDKRSSCWVDPFDAWFDDHFSFQAKKHSFSIDDEECKDNTCNSEKSLVDGKDFVHSLVSIYNNKLNNYISNYQKISELDPEIFSELNIEIYNVKKSLKQRIQNLKTHYWKELFNNIDKITNRLTSSSRSIVMRQLIEHTHIDFTPSNIYAILIWVIKNSNCYFDKQLIEFYESMVSESNIQLYKSNDKVLSKEKWRYCRSEPPKELEKYKLDYRIIVSKWRGFADPYSREFHNLSEYTINFFMDIFTIAKNIGFDIENSVRPNNVKWEEKKETFYFYNHTTGEDEILFDARVYLNGNIHVRFNQKFICKLNCEFGRLKGWLKFKEEAIDELQINPEIVESLGDELFKESFKFINYNTYNLLGLIHDETN